MYILLDVLKFEIKNNHEACVKFLTFMGRNETLLDGKIHGGGGGLGDLVMFFKTTPEVREVLNSYIVDNIKDKDHYH